MGVLYKDEKDVAVSVDIEFVEDNKVQIDFSADCGKFGTDEMLAGFCLTPKRLLQILSEREDITDEEL